MEPPRVCQRLKLRGARAVSVGGRRSVPLPPMVHRLGWLLPGLPLGQIMPRDAAGSSAGDGVVVRIMAGNAPDQRALDAALGFDG